MCHPEDDEAGKLVVAADPISEYFRSQVGASILAEFRSGLED